MALALHNYADANKGAFPDTITHYSVMVTKADPVTPKQRDVGANLLLLDFLEQSALKESFISQAFNYQADNGYNLETGAKDVPPPNVQLSCYMCPSDGQKANVGSEVAQGAINYVWCFGDHQVQRDTYLGRGPFIMSREKGMYGSLANLADGTSNTLVYSETVRPRSQNSLGAGVPYDVARKDAVALYALFDKGKKQYVCDPYTDNPQQRGFRWVDGSSWYTGFSTVLPPNSGVFSNNKGSGYVLASASSNHTGGVNGAMGDGSVQFISETVAWQTPNIPDYLLPDNSRESAAFAIAKISGASKFGVWGAMGTAAGGESAVGF